MKPKKILGAVMIISVFFGAIGLGTGDLLFALKATAAVVVGVTVYVVGFLFLISK